MNSSPAAPRLAPINRSQLVLRTVDAERLIDDDHSARLIWELVGRLDLSLYYAEIAAVEGRARRCPSIPWLRCGPNDWLRSLFAPGAAKHAQSFTYGIGQCR